MLVHPHFNPVAIQIGPVSVKWYGLMYLLGFMIGFFLGRRRIKRGQSGRITLVLLDDVLFYVVLGIILGGRLGYVLFYKAGFYFEHPLDILKVWQGGMSFHGGFIGVVLAMWVVARKYGVAWIEIMDFVAPLVPPGLAAGRIGNFINGELWGRVTDVPWGMVFPAAGPLPRHPSELYQFGLEGCLLFVILWVYSSRPRPPWAVSAVFLLGYGTMRFVVEFFREPDDFLGLLALGLSMGQWLSVPMIIGGIGMLIYAYRHAPVEAARHQ